MGTFQPSAILSRIPPFRLAAAVLLSIVLAVIVLQPAPHGSRTSEVAAVVTVGYPFVYSFNTSGVLYEAGSSGESTSPYWWLNSGAKMIIQGSVGKTNQGELPLLDKWRLMYSLTNPLDTDNGYHPQNTFRLVTKNAMGNGRVEALFKIEKDNWSSSPNRNASNGLLLMSRYQDKDTLYYAGIRVDGYAVIKKKYKGAYFTMATKRIFAGTYTAAANVNMLPHQEWIGLRTESVANADGSVTVKLFMKRDGETQWTKLLEAKDNGSYGGTAPISANGRAGIRTDFMDVSFESFRMEAI